MITIKQALARACELEQNSTTARLDTEVLLASALSRNKTYLYTWPEKLLSKNELLAFDRMMGERAQGMPVAYITGIKEFWSLPLKVNQDTLIPRPETELLVQLALDALPESTKARVADLGTGTGAIALAVASERPEWLVTGCDKTKSIVELAEQNQQALAIENVEFVQSDWCQALPLASYDLILSNPPYIESSDPHLVQGDVRFEPESALVAPQQGLADIKQIAMQARRHLKPEGCLFLEHGWEQAAAVAAILEEAGYSEIKNHQDLAGLDRVTSGQYCGG